MRQTVAGLLTVQTHQKAAMGVVTLNRCVSQLQCLLLLVQALLMKKLKTAHQIILAVKSTLKKLVRVAMAQLKQTVGSFIQILVPQIHHHAK
jgi:hypothetical protein